MCKVVQNVQSHAKCAKCSNLCNMCKVVQNMQNCAKVCKSAKVCKIVQNMHNCAKCAKLCKMCRADRADRAYRANRANWDTKVENGITDWLTGLTCRDASASKNLHCTVKKSLQNNSHYIYVAQCYYKSSSQELIIERAIV